MCQNGQIETGDIYVLAAGIMVNPLGRTNGVNLPIYPLKGNVEGEQKKSTQTFVKFGILQFCTKNSSNSTKSQNSEFHIKHVLVDFSGNNRHKKVYNTSI